MTGSQFRQARIRLGLSQVSLAELLQCHRKTIHNYEIGLRAIDPLAAEWLARQVRHLAADPPPDIGGRRSEG